ncbi:hypothetical protein G9A89_001165 [Geosiphon pyriformis]|nr:hypothetical protein G9A89_001165 [Geosiphon pyriformis]
MFLSLRRLTICNFLIQHWLQKSDTIEEVSNIQTLIADWLFKYRTTEHKDRTHSKAKATAYCKILPLLPPKFFSNTSGGPKVFKSSFAGSKFYAKAAAFVVPFVAAATDMDLNLDGPPKNTTPMLPAVSSVSNFAVESRLTSLESHLSKLSVLIKFLVKPVGVLVVLVTKLLSTLSAMNVLVK